LPPSSIAVSSVLPAFLRHPPAGCQIARPFAVLTGVRLGGAAGGPWGLASAAARDPKGTTMRTEHLDECPLCRRAADLDDDGVPVGRKEHDLYTREDWAALVRLRERQLSRHPDDVHVRLSLAEAHLLSGEPARALDLVAQCHEAEPEDPWIEDTLLEALFALGRSEADYPWRKETPAVNRLDEAFLARLDERLRLEGEPREVGLLFYELCDEAFTAFDLTELLAALRADARFVTEHDDLGPWCAWVRPAEPVDAA
jgi:hypothetical protein